MNRPELVFALVGALGSPLEEASSDLARALDGFGYRTHSVCLIDLIEGQGWSGDAGTPDRMGALMATGSKFRRVNRRGDALALLAVKRISELRNGESGDLAFVLDSLKNPAEVDTLRSIYGSRLIVVGVYSPRSNRLRVVSDRFAAAGVQPEEARELALRLLDRDADEDDVYGQGIDRTFHQADCFIGAVGTQSKMSDQLDRFVSIVFGDPFRSPTREERGMLMAAGAAAQSAELTRQVGAAVMREDGSIISVGCNEVPKPGGGVYWEGDEEDHREFTRGQDSAIGGRKEIADRVLEEVRTRVEGNQSRPDLLPVLEESIKGNLDGITEFGRAAHAEMTALFSAAAAEASVVGATVVSTTFPCHTCTKYLLTAGISRVIYISPYPRSRAADMFPEALVVEPGLPEGDEDSRMRVEPFLGVAPRRYLEYFALAWRRSRDGAGSLDDGRVVQFNPLVAQPLLPDEPPQEFQPKGPAYLERELAAIGVADSLITTERAEDE